MPSENHPRDYHLEGRAASEYLDLLRLSDRRRRGNAGFSVVQKWKLRLLS